MSLTVSRKKIGRIRTLRNIQGKFSAEAAVLKCIPSNFFLEIWRSFRTKFEKLALENYVLAYHTADKDHAEIIVKGILQGSILSLLLFYIFINDFFFFLAKCETCYFADGNSCYSCGMNLDNIFTNLIQDT